MLQYTREGWNIYIQAEDRLLLATSQFTYPSSIIVSQFKLLPGKPAWEDIAVEEVHSMVIVTKFYKSPSLIERLVCLILIVIKSEF